MVGDAAANVLGSIGYAASEVGDFFGDAWEDIEDGFCGLFGC